MNQFSGKLAIQQRVLPAYRAPFFDLLAGRCTGGLAVAAGEPLPEEAIAPAGSLSMARLTRLHNRHTFHPRHPLYACRQDGLLDWLEREDPDVLIVEANPRYRATPQAISWMKRRGRPVLGWGLGAPPLQGRLAALRAAARKRFLRRLDGILAYSHHGAREYAALGLFASGRIFTAGNAVTEPPPGPPPARDAHRQPAQVLFVGRLQQRKRLDLLLRACAALPESLQPGLTIIGEGPARPEAARLAEEIYPRARFTGELHGAALAAEFDAADLFVLPGTGGLAVQEAMSHALPVIVAEGDGSQEDLVRPANGWLVPPGDLPALQAALQAALTDPDLHRKGLESYRIVREEINLNAMADAFINAADAVRRPA